MLFPKISIVTPSFNQGQYLEQTIDSVLSQRYPNLEYIIIDGGSTDNSVEIIKKHASRLGYWVSEPDGGLYHALQKGFEQSTGDIMAWINSDDKYHPLAFFSVAEILQLPEVHWLQGNPTLFDETGRTTRVLNVRPWSKYHYYLNEYKWIQQESVFWKRDLWNKAGGYINTQLKYAGDLDLWYRFFKYDNLFTSSCLIGGFRIRKNNQLSKEHLTDYIKEAQTVLANKKLTNEEIKQINKIRLYKKIRNIINKTNFLRYNFLISIIDRKIHTHYHYPPNIYFDSTIQQYLVK